jgi:hypothetical protein
MSILDKDNPDAREFVTEILDEAHWYGALKVIVEFLRSRKVERVRVEFGFVLDRDLEEKQQGEDQVVQLSELESFIKAGIDEGIIEQKGSSDFFIYPTGVELVFMLCNDADLHFASSDSSLLAEVGRTLNSSGIKVYDSGRLL